MKRSKPIPPIWILFLVILGFLSILFCLPAFCGDPQTNPNRDPSAARKDASGIDPAVWRAALDVFAKGDSVSSSGANIASTAFRTVLDVPCLSTENTWSATQWFADVGITGYLGIIGSFSVTGIATFSDDIHAESDLNLKGNASFTIPLPVPGGGTGAGDAATARTNLGLGTMSTQNANSILVTGGVATLSAATIASATVTGQSVFSGPATFSKQVYLASMPYMVAYTGGANSLAHNTPIAATFTTEVADTHGSWDGTTYIVPEAGLYCLEAQISWDTNAVGYRIVSFLVGSADTSPPNQFIIPGSGAAQNASVLQKLKKGDLVTLKVTQTSTGALGWANNTYTWIRIAAVYLQ